MTQYEVQQKEKILFFYRVKNLYFCEGNLENILRKENDNKYILNLMTMFSSNRFFTYVKYNKFSKKNKVYTFMRFDAEGSDIFNAFLFSILLKNELDHKILLNNHDYLNIMKEKLAILHDIDTKEIINKLYDMKWNAFFLNLESKFSRYQVISNADQ